MSLTQKGFERVVYGIVHPSKRYVDSLFGLAKKGGKGASRGEGRGRKSQKQPVQAAAASHKGTAPMLSHDALHSVARQIKNGTVPVLIGHEGSDEMLDVVKGRTPDQMLPVKQIIKGLQEQDWVANAKAVEGTDTNDVMFVGGKVLDLIAPPDAFKDPWVAKILVTDPSTSHLIDSKYLNGLSLNTIGNNDQTIVVEVSLCHKPGRPMCGIIGDEETYNTR